MASQLKSSNILSIIGPGVLVAATGVGAGDLATAALTGTTVGLSVLWAVIVGAFFKFVLNEGLARWQLVTGETLLEGAMKRLGKPAQYFFLGYLLVWTFTVAAALMSACGVASQAILAVHSNPSTGKIIYGIAFSLIGVFLVRLGGYALFEKVMSVCVGLMFLTVTLTAILINPDWSEFIKGLLVPTIPDLQGEGLGWTIALMGGVGGTVTVLCYGYWIREEGRLRIEDLRISRIDLASGYGMTALFGLGMVVIGSTIQVEGQGATLIIQLANRLVEELGLLAKWAFLLGAWCAIFSSLLGVWQSVPYIFADLWNLMSSASGPTGRLVNTSSIHYRGYLYAMGTVPMIGLWVGFAQMQKVYAVLGALFMPMLALVLLFLNARSRWIGERHKNHPLTSMILFLILLFFAGTTWLTVRSILGWR